MSFLGSVSPLSWCDLAPDLISKEREFHGSTVRCIWLGAGPCDDLISITATPVDSARRPLQSVLWLSRNHTQSPSMVTVPAVPLPSRDHPHVNHTCTAPLPKAVPPGKGFWVDKGSPRSWMRAGLHNGDPTCAHKRTPSPLSASVSCPLGTTIRVLPS